MANQCCRKKPWVWTALALFLGVAGLGAWVVSGRARAAEEGAEVGHAADDGHGHAEERAKPTCSADDGHGQAAEKVADAHAEEKAKPTCSADDGHGHAAEKVADAHPEEKAKPTCSADDGHGHAAEKVADAHAEEKTEAEHGADDGHGHGKPTGMVKAAGFATAGIEDVEVGAARIGGELEAPGEILFNEDRLAHVVPLVTCTAVEVLKSLGDVVAAGEPLAIMHSADLGAAQIEYLTAAKSLELARIDLERMRTVNANTLKLHGLLRQEASPERIGEAMKDSSMGATKGQLLSRYAVLRQARAAFARAKGLQEKKVVSEGDLEMAAKELEIAKAEYQGAFEDTVFDTRDNLLKAEKSFQVAETSLLNAARRLRNMGIPDAEITALAKESIPDSHIARYVLSSKISGVVISRHLTVGEHVEVDKEAREDCFVVADLSTAWCDIRLSPTELDKVRVGQKVTLRVDGGRLPGAGRVIAVSATIDENTRAGFARALFDNPGGKLRPGLYVYASIESGDKAVDVAVPREALQTLKGNDVVFVKGSGAGEYEPRQVRLGLADKRWVELLSGVKAGERVVVRNAYVIKAEQAKGAATGCAGGH